MRKVISSCTTLFALSFATSAFAQTNFPELEPNGQKAQATAVTGIVNGDTISGTTTGTSTVFGSTLSATADVFRVKTGALPLGIYRHTLTITTTGGSAYSNYIRGLSQANGVINTASDIVFQFGSALQNSWYGFGKQEEIYYEIDGGGATTAPYTSTLTTTAVTPIAVAGAFAAGLITVTTAGQGHTTDTELYLYDSNFNPIALGHHDGVVGNSTVSTVTLSLSAGTYYIADSVFNTSNNQTDLAPTEGWDDDNLLEFPDAVACNSTFNAANVAFAVSDGLTTTMVPATKAANFDVIWATFTVVSSSGPPVNDNCANAIALGATAGGDTTNATNDGAASCDAGGAASRDVWFTVTNGSLGAQLLSLDTCGSAIDSVVSVYSACGGSELACNDDCGGAPCGASASCLSLTLNPAQVVKVRVSDKGLAGGLYTLHSKLTPLNDSCTNPTLLPGPGNYAIDTTDATTGPDGQAESLCLFFGATAVNKDLWYRYTATQNGTITVSTCSLLVGGPSEDAKIGVYATGSCPTTGSALACNDDFACPGFSGFNSTVSFPTVCGQVYLFQIGFYGNNTAGIIIGQFSVAETGTTCATPSTVFCEGNAVGTTCVACGNNGAAGRGCANSSFASGTLLSNSGIASVSADTLVLTTSDMTGPGLFFQANGLSGSPIGFGDGMLCAASGILRLGVVFPTAGSASYPGGLTPNPITVGGGPIVAGNTKHYQCWYRDAIVFCTVSTFNTSNGISLVWGP